ncbi:uncharacterized protein [Antedon mediterranea]|uniref:uncharacterized protein n=1 Tax=Antedon mediterranea TaxID=105859 RepID=UPI003AF7AEDF
MDPSVMVGTPVTQMQRHQNLHHFHTKPTLDLDTPPPPRKSKSKSKNSKSKTKFSNLSLDDINHGVEILEKCFRPVYPGQHISLKASDSMSFVHNRHSVGISTCYKQLKVLMAGRAKALILRQCIVRIRRFEAFVQHLKTNVHDEYILLERLRHEERLSFEKLETKLEYLEGFCDDFRVFLNYWTSIQHSVHSEKWLYPFYSDLISELQVVKDKLLRLQQSALLWLYDLIRVGLSVFAYYKGDELKQDFLWSVTRGVEEYNAIFKQVFGKDSTSQKNSEEKFSFGATNAFNASGFVRSLSMHSLLAFVAAERSKLVAFRTIKFVCENKNFSESFKEHQMPLDWRSYVTNGEMDQTKSSLVDKLKAESKTSLSKSDSQSLKLSRAASPLSELEAEEEEFMSQLLSIASFSTAFLHPKFHNSQQRVSRGQLNPKRHSTKENYSQSNQKRRIGRQKSVSWEDSETFGTRKLLCTWYMDQLWKFVGKELHNVLTLIRVRVEEDYHLHIGHVFQCGITHLIIILDMLQILCLKESLPSSAVISFQSLISQLYNLVAMAASDISLCNALGSSLSDKCLPATLQPGQRVSKTCSHLESSIVPLVTSLTANQNAFMFNKKQMLPKVKKESCKQELLDVLAAHQLVSTIEVGTYWCWTKAQKFLASWSISEFLLVTQCDHEIIQNLCVEAENLFEVILQETTSLKMLSTSSSQLCQVLKSLQDVSKISLQLFLEDCGKLCSDYWQKTMPAAKVWRRKTTNVLPTEPNQYSKDSTVTILQPIIEAVTYLQPAAQVSIVTIVMTTMFETWMQHILKQKPKFSIHGACQLEVDLRHVQHWFQSKTDVLCSQSTQKILSLQAFGHFESAIQLLKQQPYKINGVTQHLTGSADEINSQYSESTSKSEACRRSLGSSSESVQLGTEAADVMEHLQMSVPNSQEWLNLRVHGQNKKWVLPFSCIKTSQQI